MKIIQIGVYEDKDYETIEKLFKRRNKNGGRHNQSLCKLV